MSRDPARWLGFTICARCRREWTAGHICNDRVLSDAKLAQIRHAAAQEPEPQEKP